MRRLNLLLTERVIVLLNVANLSTLSSWVRNTDLVELDLDTVGDMNPKLRKDLQEARMLASEKHDLDYYKGILRDFQEQQLAAIAEREAKKAAADKKKASGKTKKKSTLSEVAVDDGEDVDLEDADASGELDPEEPKKASKKRKAEDGSSVSLWHYVQVW